MLIKPIRNDDDHVAALKLIDELWDAAEGSAEADELDVLATLVDTYEEKRWPVGDAEREKWQAYHERNMCVAALAHIAWKLNYPVAVTRPKIAGWDVEWLNCVYIELPTGQVSWHFHDSDQHLFEDYVIHGEVVWDGHGTSAKYDRLLRWAEDSDFGIL